MFALDSDSVCGNAPVIDEAEINYNAGYKAGATYMHKYLVELQDAVMALNPEDELEFAVILESHSVTAWLRLVGLLKEQGVIND